MTDTIYTTEYKGYIIDVDYDYFVDEDMYNDGDIKIHADERGWSIGDKNLAPQNMSLREAVDMLPTDRIFIGQYGEHSGLWLRGYDEVTTKHIDDFVDDMVTNEKKWRDDWGDEDIRDFILDEYSLYDMEEGSVTMIASRETHNDASIKKFWDLMNDYVQGNCYIISIFQNKTCEHCGNTEKEYIDGTSVVGDYEPELEDAKRMIDRY